MVIKLALETQIIELKSSTSYFNTIKYEIPKKCPHCNVVIAPTNLDSQKVSYDSSNDINFVLHRCTYCNKNYISTHLRNKSNRSTTLLSIYPEVAEESAPEIIEKFSPRFARIFQQAAKAEILNHIELAATGYRMALEVLVKEYAILENPDQEEDIKKSTLNNCLQKYFKDMPTSVAGHVVKTLGNDYAHYIQKHMDVDFKELKTYLNIFLLHIEMNLKIKHPPVPVPDLKENS